MANNKVLNVIHVNRRDTIEKWEISDLPLLYGELALGYEHISDTGSGDGDDVLSEIRAGEKSGTLCWRELKRFVPVFPIEGQSIQDIINERKNKVLGFDNEGRPTFLEHSSGALTYIVPKDNTAVTVEEHSGEYVIGLDGDGWNIICGDSSADIDNEM